MFRATVFVLNKIESNKIANHVCSTHVDDDCDGGGRVHDYGPQRHMRSRRPDEGAYAVTEIAVTVEFSAARAPSTRHCRFPDGAALRVAGLQTPAARCHHIRVWRVLGTPTQLPRCE